MKTLGHILQGMKFSALHGPAEAEMPIEQLVLDSRKAGPGTLFAAVRGTQTDGHQYLEQVAASGCRVVLCEQLPEKTAEEVTYLIARDSRLALGEICRIFYNDPSRRLRLVGTTGTNGKTTVSTLLFDLFSKLGHTCGLISTVNYRIGEQQYASTHTTPDVISLHALLSNMADAGCSYCFMEVSSHAADQDRIAGLHFAGGIFTNITHDHLDYHGSFAAYLKAKQKFFDMLPPAAFALTNRDDRNGQIMIQNTRASRYSYGLHGSADFSGKIIESDFSGMLMQIDGQEIWFRLIGDFNASNILAVYGAAFLLTGGERNDLAITLSTADRVDGRFQPIPGPDRITAIVDYAHTPDALDNVLKTINKIRSRNEQLITVVGCGGNRDKEKRPEMGRIAARLSDKVIFTSDNPRDEDPETIIEAMRQGVEPGDYKKVLAITSRREAIRTAVNMAGKGDVILVAGKGHETYQEIAGVKHPFDDRETIIEQFKTAR
jgi:UDP-N-acetylmuramoyl-L-alanyl-D-glutamate--2,6-diaminopimelate ligase